MGDTGRRIDRGEDAAQAGYLVPEDDVADAHPAPPILGVRFRSAHDKVRAELERAHLVVEPGVEVGDACLVEQHVAGFVLQRAGIAAVLPAARILVRVVLQPVPFVLVEQVARKPPGRVRPAIHRGETLAPDRATGQFRIGHECPHVHAQLRHAGRGQKHRLVALVEAWLHQHHLRLHARRHKLAVRVRHHEDAVTEQIAPRTELHTRHLLQHDRRTRFDWYPNREVSENGFESLTAGSGCFCTGFFAGVGVVVVVVVSSVSPAIRPSRLAASRSSIGAANVFSIASSFPSSACTCCEPLRMSFDSSGRAVANRAVTFDRSTGSSVTVGLLASRSIGCGGDVTRRLQMAGFAEGDETCADAAADGPLAG
uniref:Uncharacterized protein n=1 Tax=Anopheles farauti TaxID=69004 RepID=A0A182Q7W5_9DIPT